MVSCNVSQVGVRFKPVMAAAAAAAAAACCCCCCCAAANGNKGGGAGSPFLLAQGIISSLFLSARMESRLLLLLTPVVPRNIGDGATMVVSRSGDFSPVDGGGVVDFGGGGGIGGGDGVAFSPLLSPPLPQLSSLESWIVDGAGGCEAKGGGGGGGR